MKKLVLFSIVLFLVSFSMDAQTSVRGYFKSNGTYVQPHVRSSKNNTNHDNWSTKSNINPYTGSRGSVAKDYSRSALNYGSGQTIYNGSRGGQYYRNNSGTKTYVPKRKTTYGSGYNYNSTTRSSRSTSPLW